MRRMKTARASRSGLIFFEIFGITNKRVATFEHAVKKLPGAKAKTDGFVDLFWPGMLLVEQKSRGKNLDAALTQALSYFPGLAERDLPQIVIVCDFARFRVHRLETGETIEFALKDLHKHIKVFGFVAGYKALEIKPQNPVNIKAAERMGRLHDALKASGYTGHPLEVLLPAYLAKIDNRRSNISPFPRPLRNAEPTFQLRCSNLKILQVQSYSQSPARMFITLES